MRHAARAFAVFGLTMAVILFTPATVWWAQRLASPWQDARGEVLVVMAGSQLSNGLMGESSYWRAAYAVLAYREGWVRRMIVSGGSESGLPPIAGEMKRYIVAGGVPAEAVAEDAEAIGTLDSARRVSSLLRGESRKAVVLTSDYHVYRTRRMFERAGLPVAVRPVPDAGKRGSNVSGRWAAFCDLSVETAKIVYYTARGAI